MDIASVITQVNDPDIVAIDIDTIEIKTESKDHDSAAMNDVIAHNDHCLPAPAGDSGADQQTKPQSPAPTSSPTSPASAAAVSAPGDGAAKPRGGFFRDLLCCFCLDKEGRASAERRRRRRLQRQVLLQQQHQLQQQQLNRQNGQAFGGNLLGPRDPALGDRICAVIDLDETLVHSSFKYVEEPDFTIDVEIEGLVHPVYVLKRPHVDEFLEKMGQLYECVLFTASLAKYADPVSDRLDKWSAFKHRLFREACVFHSDNFVKDLAQLGRPVDRCVIIDNSPASYMFNQENAIRVHTWVGDQADTELRDLLPYLERLAAAPSVAEFLHDCPPPQQPIPLSPQLEQDRGGGGGGDGDDWVDPDAAQLGELQSPLPTTES